MSLSAEEDRELAQDALRYELLQWRERKSDVDRLLDVLEEYIVALLEATGR